MIQTINEVYNLRSGGTSKIYIQITEELNDETNEVFIYNIQDFVILSDGSRKIINTKNIEYKYIERDTLKNMLISQFNLQGSESEINKILKPYALLYITEMNPIYNLGSEDFEISPL
jgi:hypothetical protein